MLQQLCEHVYILFLILYLHFVLGELHESDLDTLVIRMSSVSDKWESIGEEVGVSDYLTYIRTLYSTPQDCMTEILRKWLQESPITTTWGHIIAALRSAGESQLADSLQAKYLPGELTTTTSSQ